MEASEIKLCQVSTGQEDDWTAVYFVEFPESERATLTRVRTDLTAGKRLLHRTLNGDALLAFSLVYLFERFVWLSYLARNRENPLSKGVGAKHLKRLLELIKERDPNIVGLFFDIELPEEEGIDAKLAEGRRKRYAFYRDLGALEMPSGRQYFMPNFQPEQPALPAKLLWFNLSAGAEVKQPALQAVIRQVYQTIYGLKADDPFLEKIASQFINEEESASSGAMSDVTKAANTASTANTGDTATGSNVSNAA